MLSLFKQIFTWWNGNTVNTRFFTWCTGVKKGEDEFGNIYYEGKMHKDGYRKRWVIYKNYSEASTIPAGWHGWIHHRVDICPAEENYIAYSWEKPHQANLTGSSHCYLPDSLKDSKSSRPVSTADYSKWVPQQSIEERL